MGPWKKKMEYDFLRVWGFVLPETSFGCNQWVEIGMCFEG